ncbi:hypothetical protein IQ247_26945 [Plectonema cf. radiosum LEGE 06105]|uniref:Uncharacterized protein n=1 Tax=Plectonema cf. radiosum LEGE 06105 TaxID=945769 RepID=A0A8J7K3X3_9CYAN|nr:hypothetical protein [Plectonema radiosum]MBE9216256.1 hypothetical protein [Plectonema cf. radiosum LEGE 06105]
MSVKSEYKTLNVFSGRLINLTFILCFFPFFKLIPFLGGEVQPLAVIPALLYLIIFKHKRLLITPIIIYLSIILIYLITAVVMFIVEPTNSPSIQSILESLIILISPLVIFVALINNLENISINIFRISIYSWFLISLLQAFYPPALVYSGLSSILSILIPRFLEKAFGGTRGVLGLSPEPSYAAQILIMIFLFSIFFYKIDKFKKNEYYFMLFACFLMFIFNASGSVFLYLFIYLISFLPLKIFKQLTFKEIHKIISLIIISILAFIIILSLFYFFIDKIFTSRVSEVITIINSTDFNIFNINELIDLTVSLGSGRSISVYIGYLNAINSYGFGSGLGSWSIHFLNAFKDSPISHVLYNIDDSKPYSYASLVAFDLGLIGLVAFTYMLFSFLLPHLKKYYVSPHSIGCFGVGIFTLYLNSVSSLPAGWLILAIILSDKGIKRKLTVSS